MGVVSSRLFLDLLVFVVYQHNLFMRRRQLNNGNVQPPVGQHVLSTSKDCITAKVLYAFVLHFHVQTYLDIYLHLCGPKK